MKRRQQKETEDSMSQFSIISKRAKLKAQEMKKMRDTDSVRDDITLASDFNAMVKRGLDDVDEMAMPVCEEEAKTPNLPKSSGLFDTFQTNHSVVKEQQE